MLKFITTLLGVLALIITRIFKKRDENKTAEEILGEKSYTETAVESAEKAADEKFGEGGKE